jgi:hypothetical protein
VAIDTIFFKTLKFFFFYKRFLTIYRRRRFFKKFKGIKKGLKFFNSKLVWFYLLNFLSLSFYKKLMSQYNMLPVSYLKNNKSHINLFKNKKIVKAIYLRLHENKVPDYFYFLNYFLKNFFEYSFKQRFQFNFIFFEGLLNKVRKKEFFRNVFFRLRRFQSLIGKGFFLEEALEVI